MRQSLVLALLTGSLGGCTGATLVDDKEETSGETDTSAEVIDDTGGESDSESEGESGGETQTAECNDDNEDCGPGTCEGEGDNMLPGADCLSCHKNGGEREADPWTIGGTLFTDLVGTDGVEGATVRITDATGQTTELTTSRVGNFYTERRMTPPFTAEVETRSGTLRMSAEVSTGACNSCHQCDGEAGGKLFEP